MKSIWKNTFIHTSLGIVSQGLVFLFVAWAARTLLPEEFGKFSFSLTYTLFFLIFIEWGTNTYTVREIGSKRKEDEPFFLLPFKLWVATFGYILLLSSTLIPKVRPFALYIMILGIGMISASFLQYFVAIFQGIGKLRYGSVLLFVQKVGYVLSGIFLIWILKNALSLTISYTIGMLTGAVVGILWIKKEFPRLKKPKMVNIVPTVKKLLPFLLVRFFSEVYFRVDIIMLQFFLGSYMVGLYALPYKIIESLMLFVNSFVFSLFPSLSYEATEKPEKFKNSLFFALRLITLWGAIILVLGLIFSRWAFYVFFGKAYEKSIVPFYILLFTLFFMQINFLLTHTLLSLKKERFYAILIIKTAILNFLLNMWFIPHYRIIGAGITTFISEIFLFIFAGYKVYRWLTKDESG